MKNFMQILICLACMYAIVMQLLRIVWLYFPSFLQRTVIYKSKDPRKTEMLLYYAVAIAVMAYFILVNMEKIFEVELFTNRV